jgi:hypothetical protein
MPVRQGEGYGYVAMAGYRPNSMRSYGAEALSPAAAPWCRARFERRIIHIVDLQADPEYNLAEVVSLGIHSALGLPMLREDEVIGVITLSRDRGDCRQRCGSRASPQSLARPPPRSAGERPPFPTEKDARVLYKLDAHVKL